MNIQWPLNYLGGKNWSELNLQTSEFSVSEVWVFGGWVFATPSNSFKLHYYVNVKKKLQNKANYCFKILVQSIKVKKES